MAGPQDNCGHGCENGLFIKAGPPRRFTCDQCEAIAPHPGSEEFYTWATEHPEVARFTEKETIECASGSLGRLARAVTRMVFIDHTRLDPIRAISEQDAALFRLLLAYAVEKSEPGRIARVLTARATATETEETP